MNFLILDNHPLVRQGMISILKENNMGKFYEADTIEQAKRTLRTEEIQMALVDLKLSGESGFDFVTYAKMEKPDLKVMIITFSSKVEDIKRAKEIMVDGYLIKDAFIEEIIYAIKLINKNGTFFSPMAEKCLESKLSNENTDQLTKREKEVLNLVKEGKSNAEIGKTLYISETTTKKHVSNILSKLNVKRRVEIIVKEGY